MASLTENGATVNDYKLFYSIISSLKLIYLVYILYFLLFLLSIIILITLIMVIIIKIIIIIIRWLSNINNSERIIKFRSAHSSERGRWVVVVWAELRLQYSWCVSLFVRARLSMMLKRLYFPGVHADFSIVSILK